MTSPASNTFSACCLKSFTWDGTPTGKESTLGDVQVYITGSNPDAAVLYIHDALGWDFVNARLLADHFAREANVTVYLPDFFFGDRINRAALSAGNWTDPSILAFISRNTRPIREPAILATASLLRTMHPKLGAVGYCFGGWGVLRLAQSIDGAPPLVDAIVCGHPSWVTEADFHGLKVPVQILSPETDGQFPVELKRVAFEKLVLEGKEPVDWVHFPGVEHGCLTKGDEGVEGEREAMVRGKDAAVGWFRQWLF